MNNFRAQDSSLLSFSLTNFFLGNGMKLSTDKLHFMELQLGLVAVVSDFVSVLLIFTRPIWWVILYNFEHMFLNLIHSEAFESLILEN